MTAPKRQKTGIKVLQVLPELNSGGVERGTLELARFLTGEGHTSLVISNGGALVPRLKQEGSRHIRLPVHRKNPLSLLQVPVLRRLLLEEKPDILHLRSRVPAWLAWLAWQRLPPAHRPRLITTVHGFYSVNRYSAVMTRGERVIAVSESVKKYLLENYPKLPGEKITVIHRGVDPREFPYGFTPDPDWLRDWNGACPDLKGKFIVTLPARITRWKGHEDFIRIASILAAKNSSFRGLLVGGTHPRKRHFLTELQGRIAEAGLTEKIILLGHRNDLREVMAVSDIVVSLSSDPEAFGRVSLEALSLGRPVVAYDHGGVREQLAELFPEGAVPVGDVEAAASRIAEWRQNPPRPRRNETFTLDRMVRQTVDLYQDLLHEQSP